MLLLTLENKFSIPICGAHQALQSIPNALLKASLSWNDLWKLWNTKGVIMLMNDIRDVLFTMSLLTLGYNGSTKIPEAIKQAYEKLTKLMPNVRTFNSDAPRMPFAEGETYLGLAWTVVIMAQDQGMPELDFVYQKKALLCGWITWSSPKMPKNVNDNAHKFIDFILRPKYAAMISENRLRSPNEAAKKKCRLSLPTIRLCIRQLICFKHAMFLWRRRRWDNGAISAVLG